MIPSTNNYLGRGESEVLPVCGVKELMVMAMMVMVIMVVVMIVVIMVVAVVIVAVVMIRVATRVKVMVLVEEHDA